MFSISDDFDDKKSLKDRRDLWDNLKDIFGGKLSWIRSFDPVSIFILNFCCCYLVSKLESYSETCFEKHKNK